MHFPFPHSAKNTRRLILHHVNCAVVAVSHHPLHHPTCPSSIPFLTSGLNPLSEGLQCQTQRSHGQVGQCAIIQVRRLLRTIHPYDGFNNIELRSPKLDATLQGQLNYARNYVLKRLLKEIAFDLLSF